MQKSVSITMSQQRQEINDIMHQCKVDKNWKKAHKKIVQVMSRIGPQDKKATPLKNAAVKMLDKSKSEDPAQFFSKTADVGIIAAELNRENPYAINRPSSLLRLRPSSSQSTASQSRSRESGYRAKYSSQ